ncbi:MAG: DUF5615 family PIN-like protein [Bacteroidota bacterium]
MNLLLDQNISFRVKKKLIKDFPECKHVSDCGLSDTEDANIWEYAKKHDFTIVTYDQDYFEISLFWGSPPKIVWIKSGNLINSEVAKLLVDNKKTIIDFITKEELKNIACLELG